MMRSLLAISLLLASVLALRIYLDRGTAPTVSPRLAELPQTIGPWHSTGDGKLSPEDLDILRADQLLVRDYEVLPGTTVQLFIAYYLTQRAGERMHSPRNCLPGSGWEPTLATLATADIDGQSVALNRYDVEKSGQKMVVLYWYQSQNRIIANEYIGRVQLIWDAFRSGARDGALVRVSMRLPEGVTTDEAARSLLQFVRVASPEITKLFVRK